MPELDSRVPQEVFEHHDVDVLPRKHRKPAVELLCVACPLDVCPISVNQASAFVAAAVDGLVCVEGSGEVGDGFPSMGCPVTMKE